MLKIIIVDDHIPSRFLLSNQLLSLGCDVTEACNGDEGLRLFVSREFDVVFTDVNMPGMNGFQFTSRVRALERGYRRSPCRIFGCTAHLDAEIVRGSKLVGMNGCYSKPIRVNDLKAYLWQLECDRTISGRNERAFDYCALVNLFNGNKTIALALCDELYESNKADLKQLNAARLIGDVSGVHHFVHRFAGGARMVGANKLLLMIRAFMGRATRDGADDQFEISIAAVCEELINVQNDLRTLLDGAPGEALGHG